MFPKRKPRDKATANEADIRSHLLHIVDSMGFRHAPRLQTFLRFVVEHSIQGTNCEIKEITVGVEVYGKQPGYDPRHDATVRVEASKLRLRLAEYYEGEGAQQPIRITIPKGAYTANIELTESPTVPGKGAHWFFAWILALVIAAVGWMWSRPPQFGRSAELKPGTLQITRLTENGTFSTDAAVSPDSQFMVYSSDRDSVGVLNLWRQSLGGGVAQRLTNSNWNHSAPTISEAGMIVYRSGEGGGVLVTLEPGKAPEVLKNSSRAQDPRFASRGKRLVYWIARDEETRDYGSVFIRDLADPGSFPVRLFGEFAHASRPIWLDQSEHLVALGTWHSQTPEKEYDAWIITLNGLYSKGLPVKTGLFPKLLAGKFYSRVTERSLIEIGGWRAGWLYFTIPSRDAVDLYRIHLDVALGKVSGEPQKLTLSSTAATEPRLTTGGLIYADSETSYNLYSLALPTAPQHSQDLRQHTSETGMNLRPSVDPNGRAMVWEKRRPGFPDQIWLHDLAGGKQQQLAVAIKEATSHALISPDGRSAAYRVSTPNIQPIFMESFAEGMPRKICENCGTPSDWSPDGSRLWYITGGYPARVGLLELATGRNDDSLIHPSYNLYGARQKVDRKGDGWLAFYADNGPLTRQIFVAPLKSYQPGGPDSWISLTDGFQWDSSPGWAADGNTVYFVSRRDGFSCLMAQVLNPTTKRPIGGPWTVHHFHEPGVTLTRRPKHRGSENLWVAGGSIYFTLEKTTSRIFLLSGLQR